MFTNLLFLVVTVACAPPFDPVFRLGNSTYKCNTPAEVLSFSDDCDSLTVKTDSGELWCFNSVTGELRWRYRPNDSKVVAGVFFARGSKVAVLSDDGVVSELLASTGERIGFLMDPTKRRAHHLGVLPNGELLALTTDTSAYREWYQGERRNIPFCVENLDTKTEVCQIGPIVWSGSFTISPDGQFASIIYNERTVGCWDLHSGEKRTMLQLPWGSESLILGHDNDHRPIVIFQTRDRMTVRNVLTGEDISVLEVSNDMKCIGLSNDGHYLVTAEWYVRDNLDSRARVQIRDLRGVTTATFDLARDAAQKGVFSKGNRYLAVSTRVDWPGAYRSQSVQLWDLHADRFLSVSVR